MSTPRLRNDAHGIARCGYSIFKDRLCTMS
jgi:hypothetical protein